MRVVRHSGNGFQTLQKYVTKVTEPWSSRIGRVRSALTRFLNTLRACLPGGVEQKVGELTRVI